MSVSEAASGRTKPATISKRPHLLLALAKNAAGILWTLAIIGAIADITDHFPRGFVVLAAALAGTTTIVMVLLSVLDALAGLERRIEQISAVVGVPGDMPAIPELPPGVVAKIYHMGRRARDREIAN